MGTGKLWWIAVLVLLVMPFAVQAQDEDLECESDTDCDDGEVCVMDTYEECSGGSGPDCDPEDPECEPAGDTEDEECTEVNSSECQPAWLAPCESADDCGPGFDCVEQESCACSGSGGADATPGTPAGEGGSSGGSDGGSAEGGGEGGGTSDDCTCEPTGEFECVLDKTACESDDDCDGDLVCGDNPDAAVSDVGDAAPPSMGTAGAMAGGMAGAGGEGGGADGGGEGGGAEEPEMVCMPEGYEDWNGGAVGVPGGETQGDGSSADNTGTSGSGSSGDGADDGEEGDEDRGGGGDDDGGCSIAGAPTGAGLTPLLFALVAITRRRRLRA